MFIAEIEIKGSGIVNMDDTLKIKNRRVHMLNPGLQIKVHI